MHIAADLLPDQVAPQQTGGAHRAGSLDRQDLVGRPKGLGQADQVRDQSAAGLEAGEPIRRFHRRRANRARRALVVI